MADEIVLHLDRETAQDLFEALYSLSEHESAGVPIPAATPEASGRLAEFLGELDEALAEQDAAAGEDDAAA